MKNKLRNYVFVFSKIVAIFALIISFVPNTASAAYYYQANGGSYFTQGGSSWTTTSGIGYCTSTRGPCGKTLWYSQWTANHAGCGYDESGLYKMSAILPYKGTVAAWVSTGKNGGTMTSADYVITYNGASSYSLGANQNKYGDVFMPLASNLYKISYVSETDGWSSAYSCNKGSGYRVEFDEVRLDV